ncbi:sulfite exporter TauE/SafE family protein [Arthrobacter sp. SX1312]|uniref:sulfite exporter TauE/SafE family protein n=1 Tax=Arthrobacter sp. SX1312 TaxID=2058896 RepID=UPI000CE2D562|nr:sulfite exporter TauE/SafE family protein [Arthrobacter sp. SX1312]
MNAVLALVLALSILIGLSLGVLGGGGSILTVPILVYVAGFEAKEAIAASLFVVGVTSAVSVISHARRGRVMWRTGLIFGAAGMVGAFVGGLLGGFVPGQILLVAFAPMMVATSIAMIRGRRKPRTATHGTASVGVRRELPLGRVLLDGVVVGLVTGLVGAGGGFLVVPALALLGGLPMSVAVGTSLVVISMKSFAGLAGYLTTVQIDWPLTLAVTAAAIVGSLIGAQLAGRIPEVALRKAFGWFVLAMGAFVLIQQVPADARPLVAAMVAGIALAALVARRFILPARPLSARNRERGDGAGAAPSLHQPHHAPSDPRRDA